MKKFKVGSGAENGFSLVVTVTVMILLSLIAVGILSLSTTTLRSSRSSLDVEIAKANAKLSLQMALGRLQALAGPDTRITAPADAGAGLSGNSPYLTGVWRSWEGLDHDIQTGQPLAPDYGLKLQKGSTVDEDDEGRFLGWLVSSDESGAITPAPNLSTPTGTDRVMLLGGQMTDASKRVFVDSTPITGPDGDITGNYAWWVQGENTKVRLNEPPEEAEDSDEATEQFLVSPGPSGSDVGIEDTTGVESVPSRRSLDFLVDGGSGGTSALTDLYHDLTVNSVGLLTNNANGGWKRDLSIFTEDFGNVPSGFPSFTLAPGKTYQASKLDSTARGSQRANLYPWVDTNPREVFPDAVSWGALADFANQYKEIQSRGSEVAQLGGGTGRTHTLWTDTVRLLPVLARIHLVVSLSASQEGRGGNYLPAILVNPVLTMWNPYSVAIDASSQGTVEFRLNEGASPLSFQFQVGRQSITNDLARICGGGGNSANIKALVPFSAEPIWLPGEVRIFSPEKTSIADVGRGSSITFAPGYQPDAGLRYTLRNGDTLVSAQAGSTQYAIKSEARVDASFGGPNVNGIGLYFTNRIGTGQNVSTQNIQNLLTTDQARRMIGDTLQLTATSSRSLTDLASSPQPFVSVISSLRFARDTNETQNNIVTNGIHQMNPAIGFIASSGTDGNISKTAAGGRYDAFPYNVHLYPVAGFTDPGMPSGITGDLEGFLGSGFNTVDGLSNLILLEVPTRPMRTIGDLEHFNVNASDSRPPYTLNAFGNSRPSPFIQPDEIRIDNKLSQDHSFAINHVLLDDWFVSSVSPRTRPWTNAETRSMEGVYADHLSLTEPLASHFYKPVETLSADDANEAASELLNDNEAWQKIAAELEVEGMFNINSTSELAWKMLLKRNFGSAGSSFVELTESEAGGRGAVSVNESAETLFPRTQITSNSQAGINSVLGQPLSFTDDHLAGLAREIVKEIRLRGPFLSLSEFFNRQLSTDVDLAKGGAVECALLTLSESSGSSNPYEPLISAGFDDQASTTDFSGGDLSYPFPEAAEGNAAYGFPAWTRQADVLRPVSGILSARDDTFTIRAYGDSREAGSNRIISQAWCEAVVQRKADYLDSSEGQWR